MLKLYVYNILKVCFCYQVKPFVQHFSFVFDYAQLSTLLLQVQHFQQFKQYTAFCTSLLCYFLDSFRYSCFVYYFVLVSLLCASYLLMLSFCYVCIAFLYFIYTSVCLVAVCLAFCSNYLYNFFYLLFLYIHKNCLIQYSLINKLLDKAYQVLCIIVNILGILQLICKQL